MLPRKMFENLHTEVAILVLFEQFLGKLCLNFLPLNLSVSPNVMHFVRTFSIMRALGVRLVVVEKLQNYEKFLFIKTSLKMAGGGDVSLTPPGSAPVRTDNNVSYHNSNHPVLL